MPFYNSMVRETSILLQCRKFVRSYFSVLWHFKAKWQRLKSEVIPKVKGEDLDFCSVSCGYEQFESSCSQILSGLPSRRRHQMYQGHK